MEGRRSVAGFRLPTIRRSTRVADRITRAREIEASYRIMKPKAAKKMVIEEVEEEFEKFDCLACGRTLPETSFPNYLCSDDCNHNINTCKTCTKRWIASQSEDKTFDKIICPECPQRMDLRHIQLHATKNVYTRLAEMRDRAEKEKIPDWRWCLNPECKSGQVHATFAKLSSSNVLGNAIRKSKAKTKGQDVSTCIECGNQACVPCDRPMHEGETCEQYRARAKKQVEADEKATAEAIKETSKPCPGCQKNIQKNGGCDHMKCTFCMTDFCWVCGTSYATIRANKGHAAGCMYAARGAVDVHYMPANFG